MIGEVFPQWVLVNGQIHRVSEFAKFRPPSRPEAICPLCNKPVTMKLGNERVHHYAHQPGVICSATQPETALHLNTKFYIYEQLLSGTHLYLEHDCANGCETSRNELWASNWERVEVEYQIHPFRPDISIINSDGTVKAIEVIVTHEVDDDKAAFYETNNINRIEVDACESIYEGENVWRIDKPLPFAVCKPSLAEWTCDNCREKLRKDEELKQKQNRFAEYLRHNYSETIYAKMVDYFYRSGKKFRETYYLNKMVRNDKPAGIEIKTASKKVILQQNGEIAETSLKELATCAVKSEIDLKSKLGAIVYDREWSPWVSGKKFVARDTERYPFLYDWDDTFKKWVKREPRKIVYWNAHPEEMYIPPQNAINITKKEGVCIFCGQTTTDWWMRDGATGKCKCYKCKDEGKQ